MNLSFKHEVRARALREAFDIWGRSLIKSKHPKLAKVFDRVTEEHYILIDDAFLEMDDHKPGSYDWWWANNHKRYSKKITNRQERTVHELMYHFLTDYVRGRLGKKEEKEV